MAWAVTTATAPTSGVNGARVIDVIPQTGKPCLGGSGAPCAFSAPPADARLASAMTDDTKPVTIRTFMTVALAYTNPGTRVGTDAGSDFSSRADGAIALLGGDHWRWL